MAIVGKRARGGDASGLRLRRKGLRISVEAGVLWLAFSVIAAADPALRATPVYPARRDPAPARAEAPPAVSKEKAVEPSPAAAPKLRRITRLPPVPVEQAAEPQGASVSGPAPSRIAVPAAPVSPDVPAPGPAQPAVGDTDFRGWTRPLSEYLRGNEAVILRHRFDRRMIEAPIPWRVTNPQVGILLRTQSSGALDPTRSQIALRWNGKTFAQELIGEGRESENLGAELSLTDSTGGRNSLEIAVIQSRLGETQDDPFHPDLWTQLLPHDSVLTLSFQLRTLENPTLDRIPDLIDSRWWQSYELNLLTPDPRDMGARQVEWMSLVSQRAALLLGETPLTISHVQGIRGHGDHIAVGTREQLAAILPRRITESITDSFFGVFPHPDDAGYFLMVLSGTGEDGVDRAVRAFLDEESILPPRPFADLSDTPVAPRATRREKGPRTALEPGKTCRFSQIGYETIDGDGLDEGQYAIRFRMPPGMRTVEWARARLTLKLSWTPVDLASTVEVRLNGQAVEKIELGERSPDGFDEREVRIPMNLFAAGENTLTLAPDLRPARRGEHGEVDWEAQHFVVSGDSSLRLPRASQLLALPDLSLLSRGAIPAANVKGGDAVVTVWPGAGDSETLGAACTLIGKLAQVAGGLLPDVRLSFQLPEPDDHYIAVGAAPAIDRRLAPAGIIGEEPGAVVSIAALGGEEMAGGLAGSGLICQFESPLKAGRIGMLLTASDSRQLEEQVRQLVRPGVWSELAGDTFTWRPESDQCMTLKRFPEFTIGDAGPLRRAWFLVATHRMPIGGAVAGIVLLAIVLCVFRALRGRDPVRGQIENRRRAHRRGDSPIWDGSRERPA